jgi:glyoxylase-like metal-dependent hydrolase (beta-lactamase superfamily II)
LDNNPRVIREDYKSIEPYVPEDASDILQSGPVSPHQIDTIILSHMHFDHTGDVSKFPDARIITGPGSRKATSPGFPAADGSPFDGTVLDHPKYMEFDLTQFVEIPKDCVPEGFSFEKGVNVFGDGSFFILDAPGHMTGHQMGLARTGDREWVAMGGDCCHHRDLLENPGRDISTDVGPNGQPGFHSHHSHARGTISRTRKLHELKDVFVALAHDAKLDGKIPFYPESLNGWSGRDLKAALRTEALTLEEVKGRYR